ncbi:MAG: lysophospholipid acyltransferase family protein, partial [Candidatus Margulisiibacteriota bacterium]
MVRFYLMIKSIVLTVLAGLFMLVSMAGGSLLAVMVAVFAKDKRRIFGNISRVWARSILFIAGVKLIVKGTENLNVAGPVVLIANHQGNFDIPVMMAALPFNFRFLVKEELFRIPLFGWYMKKRGDVSINRKSPRDAIIALKKISAIVKSGEPVMIFPEGTRSMDGKVGDFKRGSLIVAVNADARIIPIAVSGSYNIQKRGTLLVNPTTVTVNIGSPVSIKEEEENAGRESALLESIRQ